MAAEKGQGLRNQRQHVASAIPQGGRGPWQSEAAPLLANVQQQHESVARLNELYAKKQKGALTPQELTEYGQALKDAAEGKEARAQVREQIRIEKQRFDDLLH